MENLKISLELMFIGMGTTFIFLTIMVYILGAIEKFAAAFGKYILGEKHKKPAPAPTGKAKIAIAIAAAQHKHHVRRS